jgi:oligoribonuclease
MTANHLESRLAWVDLEMTGLNPSRDVILEIATIVTDADLEIIAECADLVVSWPNEILARMNGIVRKMHQKNGLMERVQSASLRLGDAEKQTLAFLKEHCPEGKIPLCGNSVWMDRHFLNRQMPRVESYLHHRVVDVSSIKELARRWRPDLLANAPQKPESHRALDDIRASIEELRHYREVWLSAKPSPGFASN